MNLKRGLLGAGIAAAFVTLPTLAMAQQTTTTTQTQAGASGSAQGTVSTPTTTTTTMGAGVPNQNLPPPRSYDEPAPPPPAPAVSETGVTKQAGVGGTQAYARAGVLELGGSTGFSRASQFTQVNVSPSIGWFFMDNVQLSGIVGINYIDTGASSSTFMTFLAEPSFHLPFSEKLYAFAGVGAGLGYAKASGAGFALAPRAGLNILVGRSGILTPALTFIYSTTDAVQTPQGTLLAVNTSYGANIGYTVMW